MGFSAFMQDVRADLARRHEQRRAASALSAPAGTRWHGGADVDDANRSAVVSIRLRPIAAARRLWANAAGSSSRLGMDASGKRVELVTEPKTGLKLPGASSPYPQFPSTHCIHASTLTRRKPENPSKSESDVSASTTPPTSGEYCTRGKTTGCAPLNGMGVRVKRIAGIPVKVYACGLYVDPSVRRKLLHNHRMPHKRHFDDTRMTPA